MADNKIVITASLDFTTSTTNIRNDLKNIADKINADKVFKIIVNADLGKTQTRIQSQLNTISKNLKLDVGNINVGNVNTRNIVGGLQSVQKQAQQTAKSVHEINTQAKDFKFPVAIKEYDDGITVTDTLKTLQNARDMFSKLGFTDVSFQWVDESGGVFEKLTARVTDSYNAVQNFKFALGQSSDDFTYDGSIGNDSGIAKNIKQIEKTYSEYTQKFAQFKSTNHELLSGLTQPLTEFETKLNGLKTGISTIEEVKSAYKSLQTASSNITQNFSRQLSPIDSAIRNISKGEETISGLKAEFKGLTNAPKEVNAELTKCASLLQNVKQIESEQGRTDVWSKAYREWIDLVDQLQAKLKTLRKEQINSASSEIFKTSDLKKADIPYMTKVSNTIEHQMAEIQKMSNAKGWQSFEVKGVEEANGKIKALTLTVRDAEGALKQLSMQRAKLDTGKKTYDGLMQVGDVKILETSVKAQQKLNDEVAEYDKKINNAIKSLNGFANNATFKNNSANSSVQMQKQAIQSLIAEYEHLKIQLQGNISPTGLKEIETHLSVLKSQFDMVQNECEELKVKLNNTKTLNKFGQDVELLRNRIIASREANSKSVKQFGKDYDSLLTFADELKTVFSNGQIDNQGLDSANRQLRILEGNIKKANVAGHTLFKSLWESAKKFSTWMGLTTVIAGAVRTIRNMTREVIELDSAMTSLKKVTDESEATYNKFLDNASKKAKELGVTITNLVDSTSEFAKLGYSMEDAAVLGEVASVYANVGELDITDATASLVSSMAAFGIEAQNAMEIVDRFNAVGNQFSISSGGIGDALQRSASSLKAAGNSIDESIAMITAANVVVQDPDIIGTSLKTLSLRLTSTSAELEALGEDTEYACETLSDYRNLVMGLTNNKVDILGDDGQYKNTYNILKDISKVWHEMDSMSQNSLMKSLFGVRQANVGVSLIEQFSTAEKVLETSLKSSGSAMKEHSRWLESAEAKIQQFKASFESFARTVINSDFLKGLIGAGTFLLNLLEKLFVIVEKIIKILPFSQFISAITKLINSQKEAAKKAEEARIEAEKRRKETVASIEAFKNEEKELRNLQEQYTKLVASTSDITSIKDDLSSIQDQIVQKYGREADAIDLLNGKYSENIKLFEELSDKKNKQWLRDNSDSIEEAEKYFEDLENRFVLGFDVTQKGKSAQEVESINTEANIYFQKLSSYLEHNNLSQYFDKYMADIATGSESQQGYFKQFMLKTDLSIEEQLKAIEGLLAGYEELMEYAGDEAHKLEFFSLDNGYNLLKEYYNQITEYYDILEDAKNKKSTTDQLTEFDKNEEISSQYYTLLDRAKELSAYLNDPKTSNSAFYQYSLELENIESEINEIIKQYPVLQDQAISAFKNIGLSLDDIPASGSGLFDKFYENFDETHGKAIENIDKMKAAMQSALKGEGLSSNDAWELLELDTKGILIPEVDSNGQFKFQLEQIIALKDQYIQKQLEIIEIDRLTAIKQKEATTKKIAQLKEELKTIEQLQEESGQGKGFLYSDPAETDARFRKIGELNNSISSLEKVEKEYNDEINRGNNLIKYYRSNLGNLSNTAAMLEAAIEGLKNQQEQLNEELDNLNSEAEARLQAQENVIDDIIDKITNEKELLEEQLDVLNKQKEELEDILDKHKTVADVVENTISKQVEEIENNKKSIEDYYDNLINNLKEENEERQDAIDLAEKEAALANAKNNKVKTYNSARGWTYEVDKEALKKAENDLLDSQTEKQIETLEKEKENATKGFDEQIEALEEYSKSWSDVVESITKAENELITQEILGSDWREKIKNKDTTILNKFKNNYQTYNTQLQSLTDNEIATLEKSIEAKEEQIETWQDYKNEIQNAANIIKSSLEDYVNYLNTVTVSENSSYEQRLGNLQNFTNNYSNLISQISAKNAEIEQTTQRIDDLTEAMNGISGDGMGSSGVSGIGNIFSETFSDIFQKIIDMIGKFGSLFTGDRNANGGVNSKTGFTWMDGTRSHSEVTFNANQAKKLYEYVAKTPNLVADTMRKAMNLSGIGSAKSLTNSTSNNQSTIVSFNNTNINLPNVNNPEQFAQQMERYINIKMTESKVK